MTQRAIRVFGLLPSVAVLLGVGTLQASAVKSEKFAIPFAFQVPHHRTMPAGEYQVEQAANSDLAVLVNMKTGQRLQFVRSAGTHQDGKVTLKFADTADGKELKEIS